MVVLNILQRTQYEYEIDSLITYKTRIVLPSQYYRPFLKKKNVVYTLVLINMHEVNKICSDP